MNNQKPMATVRVAKPFQDLFGKQITKFELWATMLFGAALSAFILIVTFHEWRSLALWQQIILILLTFDIAGGIVGNLTYSTNLYYKNDSKGRLVFILSHVQPLVFAVLLNQAHLLSIAVIVYTMITSLITNALINFPAQRLVGAIFAATGIMVMLLEVKHVPIILVTLFAAYMFKVIYGFSVDQFAEWKQR